MHIKIGKMLTIIALLAVFVTVCERTNTVASPPKNNSSLVKSTDETVFTGHENHRIGKALADQMTRAFQDANTNKPYAWFFGRDAIEVLLDQKGAVGMRIYGAYNDSGKFSPVIWGVSVDGNDIGRTSLFKALGDSAIILELTVPCPPDC